MASVPQLLSTQAHRARKATPFLVAFLLFATLFVAPAAAATPDAPGGLRVVVTLVTATPTQVVELRYPVSANDPNQDTGSFQYNVTVDTVDQGSTASLDNFEAGGGYQIFTLTFFGAPASYDFEVHGYDAPTEGTDSCTVTVDTTDLGNYDACGDMVTDFSEVLYCAPAYPSPEIGFHYTYGVQLSTVTGGEETELRFSESFNRPAYAALELPGDGSSYQFTVDIREASEGASGKDIFFFGTEDLPVGASTAGNGLTTGAFAEGLSFQLTENGNEWDMSIKWHRNGVRNTIALDTFNVNPTPAAGNSPTLTITLDQWTGVATMTLDSESFTASLNSTIDEHLGNFNTFWIEHRAGYSYMVRDGSSLCLYKAAANQGGGTGLIGEPGQSLENFDGQGGFGGDPEFPGIDVQGTADGLGIDTKFMGYILAGILIMALAILGFLTGGTTGAGVGSALAVIGTTILNLTPYWLLILILLLSISIVALNFKGGSD